MSTPDNQVLAEEIRRFEEERFEAMLRCDVGKQSAWSSPSRQDTAAEWHANE
jgi:hypothetical protein